MATTEAAYRIDGARHIYLNHPERIHDGLLPPFLHAIAGVRTTIDAHGRVSRIEITREPAVAREVLPWIERLGWSARFDLAMLDATLEYLAANRWPLALSLSGSTMPL